MEKWDFTGASGENGSGFWLTAYSGVPVCLVQDCQKIFKRQKNQTRNQTSIIPDNVKTTSCRKWEPKGILAPSISVDCGTEERMGLCLGTTLYQDTDGKASSTVS